MLILVRMEHKRKRQRELDAEALVGLLFHVLCPLSDGLYVESVQGDRKWRIDRHGVGTVHAFRGLNVQRGRRKKDEGKEEAS